MSDPTGRRVIHGGEDGVRYEGFKEIHVADWLARAEQLFGPNKDDWKFKCPNCGHVQSFKDFRSLPHEPKGYPSPYQECIGRYDPGMGRCGTLYDKIAPCDYVAYGFACLVETIVIDDTGRPHPVFEFAEAP